MSQLQYIGARYVPKWYVNSIDQTANWEVNVEYEPLTWVTTVNNHLYLSKKTVPDNIGTPAQNTEYWLDLGSFTSGATEEIQQEIDRIIERLSIIDNKIENIPANRNFILFGDSLGMGVYYVGTQMKYATGWAQYATNIIGSDHVVNCCVNGGGFIGVNNVPQEAYLYQLQHATFPEGLTDDDITDIVILGGSNDTVNSVLSVKAKIQEFCEYVRERFKNLRNITCACFCEPKFATPTFARYRYINEYGGCYVPDTENLLCASNFFDSSKHIHLSPAGYDFYNPYALDIILNGRCHYEFAIEVTGTSNFGLAADFSWDTSKGTPRLTYLITEKTVKAIMEGTGANYGCCLNCPSGNSSGTYAYSQFLEVITDLSDKCYIKDAAGTASTVGHGGQLVSTNFMDKYGECNFVMQDYNRHASGHNVIFVQYSKPSTVASKMLINSIIMSPGDDTYHMTH